MRSLFVLTAVLVLGILVTPTQAGIIETLTNPMTTAPTINGADADWGGAGKYTSDGLWDLFYGNPGNLNEIGRVDFEYVRMGHDDTNLYIYCQFNTARNIYGNNASDGVMMFDTDRDPLTGRVHTSYFGEDEIIYPMNPTASVKLYHQPGGSPARTFGANAAYGTTSGRYTAAEFKIPWTWFGVTDLSSYDGFYWMASSGRGRDQYPNNENNKDLHGRDYFLYSPNPIPEPGTMALLAAGLIGLLCYAWRKRK